MRVKGNKRSKIALLLGVAGATLLATGFFASSAMAQVKGVCSNCHTMHNSQNGATEVHIGEVGTNAWNIGTGQFGGGTITGVQQQLLKSDCVGCHSASDGATTIVTDANGNKVPIVFNLGGYPTGSELAGGNFALNTGNADVYGHNVGGISDKDNTIAALEPPGSLNSCGTGCHATLALTEVEIAAMPLSDEFSYGGIKQGKFNGCKGCHNKVAHHDANDTSYRFLGGHNEVDLFSGVPGLDKVLGTEDPDWEQNPSSAVHNVYKKQDNPNVKDSMGTFCAGCHQNFHALGQLDPMDPDPWGVYNAGDDNTDGLITANSGSSPWLRHPTNVNIPIADPAGEYKFMFNIAYEPSVPVAQTLGVNTDTIEAGDQVMCLSCHRAHASQYPDALRFDYADMDAHGGANTTGCFFCHTTKDD